MIDNPACWNFEYGDKILAFKYVEYMKIPVFLRNSALYNVDDYDFTVNGKYKVFGADALMDVLVNLYSQEAIRK